MTAVRWRVVASVFLLAFITIVDRVAISAAKQSMAGELGLTDVQFGWIFGAFTIGYALFMLPSGWLADRYGPRVFLAAVVCAWSLFTVATGLVSSLVPLFLVRLMFGLAEAGAYPTASRAIYNWVPAGERGLALGIMNTGSRAGAAAGLAVTTFIVLWAGWRVSFFLLGVAGSLWALYWYLWYRDDPARKRSVSESELHHILAGRGGKAEISAPRESWTRVVFSQPGALLLYQYFANNFTFFLVLSWFLPYLQRHFGLSPERAGLYSGIPLYATMVSTWLGGFSADQLFRRGYARISRALPGMAGFCLAAAGILAAAYAETPGLFVVCFSLAAFGVDLTTGPSWTVSSDIGKRNTGAVSGAMNTMGAAGSFAASVTFPYLLELTGSVRAYCFVAASLSLLAAVCWARLGWFGPTRAEGPEADRLAPRGERG